MRKILALTAISAGLLASTSVMAGPLVTATQTAVFNFAALDDATTVSFAGFDSSLGILNSVHFGWTMDKTLNNKIINTNTTPKGIGVPLLSSATSTTTFTGPAGLTDVNTLTTPGFTGTVPGFFAVTQVGTASATGIHGAVCLSNDASCGAGSSNLSSYIGGLNFVNISIANVGSQGGSVPPGVFSGNDGYASGTLSLYYDYSAIPPVKVPEPTTLTILGLGLAGLGFSVRKRKA